MTSQRKNIVALHGAGMHAGVWGSVIAGLSLPCDAVSFPGHGKTEGNFLPSIEEMAAWTCTQLDDHAPQSVVLLGHSMGALVALEAARHPSISALVLLGAAAAMPVHGELLYQAAEDPETAMDMILKWGVSPVHQQGFAVRTILKEQMRLTAPGALLNDLTACNIYQGGEGAARGIHLPALIISGLDDKLTKPANSQALSEMMPQGQLRVLQDTGHMLMVERAAETAKEINEFTEGLLS